MMCLSHYAKAKHRNRAKFSQNFYAASPVKDF